jgi:TRAP-type C4-dicarboxylate transport system substrate-binding protein
MPLSVSGSVQGHFMNLNYWKKFSPEQQQKITAAFKQMEDQMWDLAERVNDDAVNCNVGKEPCKEGVKFKMQLVDVTPEDANRVKSAVTAAVLPLWKQTCNKVDPKCTETWNGTVGKVRGYKID